MKFEGKYAEIRSDCPSVCPVTQLVVKTTVPMQFQLLTVQAKCFDVNVKEVEGSPCVEGKVEFRLNFVDTDEKLGCETYVADVNKKIENVPEGFIPAFAVARVLETEYKQDTDQVELSSLLEIDLWGALKKTEKALVNSTGAYTKGGEINCTEIKGDFCGVTEISEEFATGERIGKALFFEATACTRSMTAGEGRVNICGNITASVTLDGERGVLTKTYTIAFNEEIEANNAETGDAVFGQVEVKRTILNCREDDNVLRFDVTLSAKGLILTDKKRDVICDVFSTSEGLRPEYTDACIVKISKGMEYSERMGGIFTTSENHKQMRDVVAVSSSGINFGKMIAEDGYVVAEGIVNAAVIYTDYDDKIASVDAELPFVVKLPEVTAEQGVDICMNAKAVELSARIRREHEVELNCDLRFYGYLLKSGKQTLIKDVEVSEKVPEERAAIGIYYVEKGESLWDVAKGLGCSPEDVTALNPDLSGTLKGGERVTVFRRLG